MGAGATHLPGGCKLYSFRLPLHPVRLRTLDERARSPETVKLSTHLLCMLRIPRHHLLPHLQHTLRLRLAAMIICKSARVVRPILPLLAPCRPEGITLYLGSHPVDQLRLPGALHRLDRLRGERSSQLKARACGGRASQTQRARERTACLCCRALRYSCLPPSTRAASCISRVARLRHDSQRCCLRCRALCSLTGFACMRDTRGHLCSFRRRSRSAPARRSCSTAHLE